MSLTFTLKTEIPAKAERIYNAWLDSEEHAEMTDAEFAIASHKLGAKHQAHGDYIWGENLELIPFQKIIQTWRNAGFKESDENSILEVYFEEKDGITEITLIHKNVPDQEFEVETGWNDYYFEPMKGYFSKK